MNAGMLVLLHGKKLIGRIVITEAVGEYPGGAAKVFALNLDPGAPEICLNVRHPTWRVPGNRKGEMGIFDQETIVLMPRSVGLSQCKNLRVG